jgi:hypothetical protein
MIFFFGNQYVLLWKNIFHKGKMIFQYGKISFIREGYFPSYLSTTEKILLIWKIIFYHGKYFFCNGKYFSSTENIFSAMENIFA